MSSVSQASFWERMGLQSTDRQVCVRTIKETYPGSRVESHVEQGYCSFTLLVSPPTLIPESSDRQKDAHRATSTRSSPPFIVQLRPQQHSLDESILRAACSIYKGFAPLVRHLQCPLPGGLTAAEMDLKKGIPLSTLLAREPHRMNTHTYEKRIRLVESLASFVGRAWPRATDKATPTRRTRADSPMLDGPSWLTECTGKVGRNIIPKLEKLSRQLPDSALRERARQTLDHLMGIEDYPVVLNHGDLIPTNILVDETTWEITAVIDWAEAEWLPFGTCLYGVDHLLGSLDYSSSTPRFQFDEGAEVLRMAFWRKLVEGNRDMEARLEDVTIMRDLGVFLWLGYAWDDGKIDRVVNEVNDAEELARLRAFLSV